MWATLRTSPSVEISFRPTGKDCYASPDTSLIGNAEHSVHGGNAFANLFGPGATAQSRAEMEQQLRAPAFRRPPSHEAGGSKTSDCPDVSAEGGEGSIQRGLGLLSLGWDTPKDRTSPSGSVGRRPAA